jgi:hypothetical protein
LKGLRRNSPFPALRSTLPFLATAAFLLCGASCNRTSAPSFQRLAIGPANVLIDDSQYEWLRTAVPVILEYDLSTAKDLVATITSSDPGAYAVQATAVAAAMVEGGSSRFDLEIAMRDLATQRTSAVIKTSAHAGIISVVDDAAKRIDADATPFPTHNEAALHAYIDAMGAREISVVIQRLQDAVHADPRFGAAQVALINAEARAGAADLRTAITGATQYRNAFTPLDRARYDAAVCRATHAPLAKLEGTAVAILQVAPNDLDALSIAGSVSFLNGDAARGQLLLGRAFELSPGNPEVRMQLAVGSLEAKQFQRAEALFAKGSTPVEVVDRAVCVLLQGDVARANSVINGLLQAQMVAGNALAALSRAEWTAATGALQDALSLLRSTSWPTPQTQALARAHAAIWLALLNKTGDADLQIAGSGSGPGSETLLAYQAFLRADYKSAEQHWRSLHNASGGADLRSRAMLASCLDHLGRTSEIAALKVEPFVPNLSGTDPFSVISFLEMRRLLQLKL